MHALQPTPRHTLIAQEATIWKTGRSGHPIVWENV